MVEKLKLQIVSKVGYGGYVRKHFLQSLVDKPIIGLSLYLNEIRHLADFMNSRKAKPFFVAYFYRVGHNITPYLDTKSTT
jgi:hypothetical protein